MSFEHCELGHSGAPFETLLPRNREWAANVKADDPHFFKLSARGQSPKTLWIGCSDSRVTESVITGSKPGDIFVQRNIGNLFHLNDTNGESVLSYAVRHLKIKHVVVVGHSHCGGCEAALLASEHGPDASADPELPRDAPINIWLAPLVKLAWSLRQAHGQVSLDELVTANVKAQVEELKKSSTIKDNRDVKFHGWLYRLEKGLLEDSKETVSTQDPAMETGIFEALQ